MFAEALVTDAAMEPADLDTSGLADALVRVRADQAECEARRWALVAEWAVAHQVARGRPDLPGGERLVDRGGEGTPRIAEFAAVELGFLLGVTTTTAGAMLADTQNLVHRHPLLWQLVLDGKVPGWKAQQIVRRCQTVGLRLEQARQVDADTRDAVTGLPWTRFLPVLEGRIIAADPEAAEARRQAEATRRYLGTSRPDANGLANLYARHDADQVMLFAAMADRIAQILALQGDEDPVDVRRAKAVGILADPARAFRMLAEAEAGAYGPAGDELSPEGDWRARRRLDDAVATTPHPDPDDPGPDDPGAGARADIDLADLVGTAQLTPVTAAGPAAPHDCCAFCGCDCAATERTRQLGRLPDVLAALEALSRRHRLTAPSATLYVHITPGSPVARVEDLGPVTLAQAVEWLGHRNVTVRPVVDATDTPPVDRYEAPARIRETVLLAEPYEVFPHGTLPSRKADLDHVQPYRGGSDPPAGQTRVGNLAPLSRLHHRAKTHAGWRLHHDGNGTYRWRSPTGHWAAVTAGRTCHYTPMEARLADLLFDIDVG